MPIGQLRTESDLENFVQAQLDRLALPQSVNTLKSICSHEHFGEGSPEGVVEAPVGDRYRQTDGGTGTAFWVKETGAATSTGWVAHG